MGNQRSSLLLTSQLADTTSSSTGSVYSYARLLLCSSGWMVHPIQFSAFHLSSRLTNTTFFFYCYRVLLGDTLRNDNDRLLPSWLAQLPRTLFFKFTRTHCEMICFFLLGWLVDTSSLGTTSTTSSSSRALLEH